MILDVRGQRKQAEGYYYMTLEVEGGEGASQVDAKHYLMTPYLPPSKNLIY